MIKYIVGALVLGQCCVDVGSMHALHKTKTKTVVQPVVAEVVAETTMSVKDLVTRLSLVCTPRQKIIAWTLFGLFWTGLLVYYRKNCIAKTLNFWDWIRRVHHSQMDRDRRLYEEVTKGNPWWTEMWWYRGACVNGQVSGESPLHKAAEIGNEQIARWLLKHGAEVNKLDSNGRTALMRTIVSPSLQTEAIVYLLKQHGASLDVQDTLGDTVVHKVAWRPSQPTERSLESLIAPTNINAVNKNGETPLMKVVADRSIEYAVNPGAVDADQLTRIASILLSHGAVIYGSTEGKDSALMRAIKVGHVPIVRQLLEKYTDPEHQTEIHEAFKFALTYLKDKALKGMLFGKLVDLRYQALKMSGKSRDEVEVDLLQQLLGAAVSLAITGQEAAQQEAAQVMLEGLIEVCRPEHRQDLLDFALWQVINAPQPPLKCIECLLKHGADINKKYDEETGETLLIKATKAQQVELVQLMVKKINCIRVAPGYVELPVIGMPINQKDKRGYTALHYAAEEGSIDIVRILLDAGAEANLAGQDNKTPKMLAREKNRLTVVQEIEEREKKARPAANGSWWSYRVL